MLVKAPDVVEAVEMLAGTLDRARKGSAHIASGFADVAATRLVRHLGDDVIQSWSFAPDGSKSTRTRPVKSFECLIDQIQNAPGSKITVAMMSAMSGMSRATLHRTFKKAFGDTPMTYLLRLRTERACQLIEDSQLTLSQIASECGFCDQAHMSRMVKAITGKSPSEFV
ncbi:MAG: helix-turn-helix domain-containing protein [Litorimonas sp.]